tara:strand:+ start:118 stop:285 length:168 start_codon:yes stop_codon:yes gene_type:complete
MDCKDVTYEDFLKWFNDPANDEEARMFFHDAILDKVYQLEQEDYFGTEGFDYRFR